MTQYGSYALKKFFCFISAVFLHLLQQLVELKIAAKKTKQKQNKTKRNIYKRKETSKEVG